MKRDYIKEPFYTQAAQYAHQEEGIIVFSAPYRAPSKKQEIQQGKQFPRVNVRYIKILT